MLAGGETRVTRPVEEVEGVGRGFDEAEGLMEAGLGEGTVGGKGGFKLYGPGLCIDEQGHFSGFLAFSGFGLLMVDIIFTVVGFRDSGSGGSILFGE